MSNMRSALLFFVTNYLKDDPLTDHNQATQLRAIH